MLKRLKNNRLARNTLSAFIGMGIRIGIQAVYFVLIARSLGNEGYGAFIGTVSLVALLAPYASLGAGNLLIKNVSRDPQTFTIYWGNGLFTTVVSATSLIGLVVVLAWLFLPNSISLLIVLLIAISDILFTRLMDLSAQAYQAFQRFNRIAQFQVLFSGSRLLSALALVVVVEQPKPLDWGWFYLLSTLISCIIAVTLVCRELGMPKLEIRRIPIEIKEGFYFAVSLSSQNIYNDLDKTMLTRLATLEEAGIYAAGYRIIDVAFTPVRSLLYAAYARFFKHGSDGIWGSLSFAKRLLPAAAGYGLLTGLAIYLTAPFMPVILGSEYEASVDVLRWLAIIPFLRSVHYFAADTLTGSDHQGVRTGVQVFVTIVSVVINTWLIPLYSWKGAAMAAICSDALLVIGLWGAVKVVSSRKRSNEIQHFTQVGGKKLRTLFKQIINRKEVEKGFVYFGLFVYSWAIFPLLGQYYKTFDLMGKALKLGVFALTLLFSLHHFRTVIRGIRQDLWIWALVLLGVLSILWSDFKGETLQKSVTLFFMTLFGVYIGSRFTLKQLFRMLAKVMMVVIALSFFFALALSEFGVDHDYLHKGAWQGVYPQKNSLGRMMVFSSLIFIFYLMLNRSEDRKKKIFPILGLLFSVTLILLSTSKTALLVFVALLLVFPLYKIFRLSSKLAVSIFILVMVLSGIGAFVFVKYADVIFALMGRDATLTGRTPLWQAAISMIEKKPLLGYGLDGFWQGMDGPSAIMWNLFHWVPKHAHNGWIDLALELGAVGLVLFLVSYLLNLLFAVRYLRKPEKPEIVWPFIYLMFMLFYNMTESTILNYNSQMFWVTYAATFCSARLSQEYSEVIEAIEGNDDENTVNQTA